MAAVSSQKKLNKAAFAELRTHRKLLIIINILMLTGAALYALMGSFYARYEYNATTISNQMTEEFSPSWLGITLMVIGVFTGLFAVVNLFRDMNSSQTCDVQHSLPMSANERYFSKLLALLYMHIIPVVVYSGIAAIICQISCAAHNVRNMDLNVLVFFVLLASALFIDAVAVFCTCCCGALAESIYFTIIVMGCISIAPALVYMRLTNQFAGLSIDVPDFFGLWTFSFVITQKLKLASLSINCLISIAVMLLTLFIYRRRDARSVGKPIAYKLFFEFVMALGVISVYSLSMFNSELYIGLVIVAIIYIVINIVVSRAKITLRSFMIWLVKYAVTTVAFICVAAAAYFTDGFGLKYHLPIENLDGAIIDVYLYDEQYDVSYYSYDRLDTLKNDMHWVTEPSDLNDAQVREVIRTFQKHSSNKEKSLGIFFRDLMCTDNNYSFRPYSYYNDQNINVSKVVSADKAGKNSGYTREYLEIRDKVVVEVHDQYLSMSSEDIGALIDDLDSLGYLYKKVGTYYFDGEGTWWESYEDYCIANGLDPNSEPEHGYFY